MRNLRMAEWESMSYGTMPTLSDFDLHLRDAKDEEGALLVSPSPPAYWMTLVEEDEIVAAQAAARAVGRGVKSGPDRLYAWKTTFEIRTVPDLYKFIESLVAQWNQGNEAAGNLASSIMYTLQYEWI